MAKQDFIYLCLLLIKLCVFRCIEGVAYKAGVVEYESYRLHAPLTPRGVIRKNTERYLQIIKTAEQNKVDILVFPEFGLTSTDVPSEREWTEPYSTEIPTVGVKPCDLQEIPDVLKELSCAALTNRLYIVFNLVELVPCIKDQPGCSPDGQLFYNTNVALDRNGSIISKYRKFNLFNEPQFNITETADIRWFDTDFGARFGMFIGYDILFKEPTYTLIRQHKISNFVLPVAWLSTFPFFTAVGIQESWAYEHNVNLLASGYSDTPRRQGGSGVYGGHDGHLVALLPEHSTTALLITEVSNKREHKPKEEPKTIVISQDNVSDLVTSGSNIEDFTTVPLTDTTAELVYEKDGFMCNVSVVVSERVEAGYYYKLVAYSGLKASVTRDIEVEVCGLIACRTSSTSQCDRPEENSLKTFFSKISVSASSSKEMLTYPETINEDLIPISRDMYQYRMSEQNGRYEVGLDTRKPVSGLVVFAIYRNA